MRPTRFNPYAGDLFCAFCVAKASGDVEKAKVAATIVGGVAVCLDHFHFAATNPQFQLGIHHMLDEDRRSKEKGAKLRDMVAEARERRKADDHRLADGTTSADHAGHGCSEDPTKHKEPVDDAE